MRRIFVYGFALVSAIIAISACKKEETFPALGDSVASPIDVAVDASEQYFYALNSDFPRDYNQGSLMVLDTNGTKVKVIPTARLGRSLTVAGNVLIVTFSNAGDSGQSIKLYDISDPKEPKLSKEFAPESCNPINAAAKSGYSYWVVSCSNGKIFAGDLASPLENSTLNLVRSYPGARRAIHIDTSRNLLLSFPTNLGDQVWGDALLDDAETYSEENGSLTKSSNEIPDVWEKSRADRTNKNRRGLYQFAVYDLKVGHDNGWKSLELKDSLADLRWIYFNLSNFDGSPDVAQTTENATKRYYRTNFWAVQPDSEDSDVFYLSQRGSADARHGGSQHANSIIKVRITGDLKSTSQTSEELLAYERVYGFKGELDPSGRHYPGAFAISTIKGQPVLVVNHFRDLVNWPGQAYFSIAAKVLGSNHWFSEIASTSTSKTYFQIALTSSGRAMAANFYGNSLILLDVVPGVGITEKETIIK
jgi:hypothetical protein